MFLKYKSKPSTCSSNKIDGYSLIKFLILNLSEYLIAPFIKVSFKLMSSSCSNSLLINRHFDDNYLSDTTNDLKQSKIDW
jgi:hypothetical protein